MSGCPSALSLGVWQDLLIVPLALFVRLLCPEARERSPTVNYVDDVCLHIRLRVPPEYWESATTTRCSSREPEIPSGEEEDAPFDPLSMWPFSFLRR